MRTKRFLLMLCVLIQVGFSRADTQPYIVIQLKSGENVYLKHEDKMKIQLEDGLFTIGSSIYQLSDIRKYTLQELDPTSVEQKLVLGKGIELVDGRLAVKNAEILEKVHVYATDGTEVPLPAIKGDGENYWVPLYGLGY